MHAPLQSPDPSHPQRRLGRDSAVAAVCGLVVALMVGASYAAVPFYNWFCRVTGYNGTTQVASEAPRTAPLSRHIAVRFDANVNGLPWTLRPEHNEIELAIGQVTTVYYHATNRSDQYSAGLAAYNVAPLTVGSYFQKINCFCFTEQTLGPGESRAMPVVFYIDPAIARDRDADTLNTITLSYTFYPVRGETRPQVAGDSKKDQGAL